MAISLPLRRTSLNMLESTTCQVLCRKQYDKEDLDKFKGFIEKKYFAHWILEGLPVISRKPADLRG